MGGVEGFPHLLFIKLHSILCNAWDDDVLQLSFVYLAVAIGVVHLVGAQCHDLCAELDETATRVENDDEHGGGDDEIGKDKVIIW